MNKISDQIKNILQSGVAIPAVPMALTEERQFDRQRQRALLRYYNAAGVGGMAVGVHTTQFAIRDAQHKLFEPVLSYAAEVIEQLDQSRENPLIRIGGICGQTKQATAEAEFLTAQGYHAGLLNLVAMRDASIDELIVHCRAVADVMPVFGFHLGVGIGGRELPYEFWCRFAEIENVVAIKLACFDRYQTIECVRAIAEAGREDIALYTGNDDNIILDLLMPFRFQVDGKQVERRIVGGLLGHWAVWTKPGVEQLEQCQKLVAAGSQITPDLLSLANEVTDSNAAFFDPAHKFAGCIPGLEEVLRRQGLFANNLCLNPGEVLSPGQLEEIERVYQAYPHLHDDVFVAEHLEEWLAD